jgi:cytochrome b561
LGQYQAFEPSTPEKHMYRKIVAITLFVSFVAMSTSGLLMFVISRPSFTMQMHPVHKLFGLLLVAAALAHIILNFRGLKAHVKARAASLWGAALVAALVGLYAVALSNTVPADTAAALDALAQKAEQQMEGR